MGVEAYLHDLAVALRFLSRLPIPALPGEACPHAAPDFTRAARAVPMAGAILGAIGAAALALAHAVGLPAAACGWIAVGALLLITGAFHEDGLADAADGMGGGSTRARKLDIMKDSRIGTYGAAALIVTLALRATLIAELLARHGPLAAAGALVASGALSRAAALWPVHALPAARPDGAAFAAGRPTREAMTTAGLTAALVLVVAAGGTAGLGAAGLVLAGAALAAYVMTRLALAQLGGQTGDVAGATQQAAEALILACLLVAHR